MSDILVSERWIDGESAIARIALAAGALADAICAEQAAITERDDYLIALVYSLIGSPNALTNKPHSQSSAEAAAKEDARYRELCTARTEAECARLKASAAYEMARLTARLHVSTLEQAL